MWQAVVLAHYRALDGASIDNACNTTYRKYTNHLGIEAKNICNYIFDIHSWLEDPDNPMKSDGKTPCPKLATTLVDLRRDEKSHKLRRWRNKLFNLSPKG